jgi:short-subunit dehydrogenase
LALALANEVRDFGIHVSVLMPGDVATGFTDARKKDVKGGEVYQRLHSAVSRMEQDERSGMAPICMAKCLYRIAVAKCPKPFYVGGTIYGVFSLLNRLLPKRLVNWIVGKLYC